MKESSWTRTLSASQVDMLVNIRRWQLMETGRLLPSPLPSWRGFQGMATVVEWIVSSWLGIQWSVNRALLGQWVQWPGFFWKLPNTTHWHLYCSISKGKFPCWIWCHLAESKVRHFFHQWKSWPAVRGRLITLLGLHSAFATFCVAVGSLHDSSEPQFLHL